MGKFITNSFKLRKADESRKNVPFEYYAVFSGKEFNIPVVDVFRKGKIFGSSLDFAKVVFLPVGAKSYENALDMGQKIVTSIKKKIRYGTMSSIEENDDILTRDIRGYLYDIFDVMKMMSSAVKSCGFKMGEDVVYFGPMGCQTGFYLLVRSAQSPKEVFDMTKKVLKQIIDHEGEVFGASAIECGHYENLSLEAARMEAKLYLEVLEAQTNMEFTYPEA